MTTLFLNYEQAADLLNTDVEGVKAYIREGELTVGTDGIPCDEVALFLLEKQAQTGQ